MKKILERAKLNLVFTLYCSLLYGGLFAQSFCEGSLGSNIFIEGDFGSGVSNILPVDPNIAPGYIYTQQMPPDDGYYTITNNSGNWPSIYGSWVQTGDNSSDPNGYFMVVNASFTPGVFYEQEITGLCENTLYEFSADMINMIREGVENHILPNVAFFLNDVEQFNTGDIPQTNQWLSYGFSFATSPGVTSLKLTLRNNAPGGIGNDLGLDNINFRACGPLAFIDPSDRTELCKDDPVFNLSAVIEEDQAIFDQLQWQLSLDFGLNWQNIPGAMDETYVHNSNVVGTYLYRYLLATSPENLDNIKCRVQSEIAEVVVLPEEFEAQDTICLGNELDINGQIISDAGDYVVELVGNSGCDSIVFLSLETIEDDPDDVDISIEHPVCPENPLGTLTVEYLNPGRGPYKLYLNDELQTVSSLIKLYSGEYLITVEDRFGCETNYPVEIFTPDPFIVDAGEDLDLILGEQIQISVWSNQLIESVSWSPPVGLDCPDCEIVNLTAARSEVYRVEAVNLDDCLNSDSIRISVDATKKVFIPSAFSPNGDLINDDFGVFAYGGSLLNVRNFLVFDRWGNLIFSRVNAGQNVAGALWNGQSANKEVPSGVYVYFLELEFLDGEVIVYNGDLTVYR